MDRTTVIKALHSAGIAAETDEVTITPLSGGVSSEIWRLDVDGRSYCVKQALERLKVEAEWLAPVERNRFEVCWNNIAQRVAPGSAPAVRHHDDERMFFVMDYLDPERYELWKEKLLRGRAEPRDADGVGRVLSRIHAATAGDPEISALFPRSDIFHDIRLEPYLLATGARHPDLAARLESLSRRTAGNRITMIHGDVSPKNILIGPRGPVFLDAECACIGDPAFDIAFCLNHMLLKCLWKRAAADAYLECFDALADAYLAGVDWEPPAGLEGRAAGLLPALLLARVDGKSPVEYIDDEADRERVRGCARDLLTAEPAGLGEVAAAWREALRR